MTQRRNVPSPFGILSAGHSLLGLLVVCVVALAGSLVAAVPAPARVPHPLPAASLTVQPTQGPKGASATLSGHCAPAYITNPPHVLPTPIAGIAAQVNLGFDFFSGQIKTTGGSFTYATTVPAVVPGLYPVTGLCYTVDAHGMGIGGLAGQPPEQVAQLPPTTFCVTPDPACNLSPWPLFLESQMLRWSGFAGVLIGQLVKPFLPAASPTTTTSTSATTTPSQRSGSGGPPPPAVGTQPPPPVPTTAPCGPYPPYTLIDGRCQKFG